MIDSRQNGGKFFQPGMQMKLLFVTAFVFFFTKLWAGDMGGDECCYSTLAREIWRTGDWWVLHHPYQAEWANFYEHPPLYIWLIAIAFKFFGETAFAAKLFSALAGIGSIVVVYYTGRKLRDHSYGFTAGFILLTTQYFLDYSRKARLEIPLTFWILLSFFFLILALRNQKWWWSFFAGNAAALAFLTKGVPAFSALIAAFFGFLLIFGLRKNFWIYSSICFSGFLIIILPWSMIQYIVDEGRFFDWYFFKQVAYSVGGRSTVTPDNTFQYLSIFHYIEKLLTEVMVPWFIVAIYGSYRLIRNHSFNRDRVLYLTLFAALVIIASFSIVLFKKTRYILPAVPFLCFLAAEAFYGRIWYQTFNHWGARIIFSLFTIAVILGCFTPLPFNSNFKSDIVNLIPIVKENTAPGDTLLCYGEKTYTIRQVYSWYFDRPQEICSSSEEFFIKWDSGSYSSGLFAGKWTDESMNSNTESVPKFISGNYRFYLREDLPTPITVYKRASDRR